MPTKQTNPGWGPEMLSAGSTDVSPPSRKLAHFFPLVPAEQRILAQWAERAVRVGSGTDLTQEGQPYKAVLLIQHGWLARYRLHKEGRRQIVNFLLPGDVFDIGALLFKTAAQTVTAITPAVVTQIDPEEMLQIFQQHPRLAVALTWSAAQESSILSEHLVNVGRRSAVERLAHIILELHRRLSATGLASDTAYDLPLTQSLLGDALGLTPVHISRTLRRLREMGCIRLSGQTLTILDAARLKTVADFKPNFLHLGGAPEVVRESLGELPGSAPTGV